MSQMDKDQIIHIIILSLNHQSYIDHVAVLEHTQLDISML